jgi:Ca-activated chloride channel family protein
MSFQWPLALLGLLLVPLALVGYALIQRRRTQYAVRFTNLDLLANVVDRSPGWRRHVPAGLALLALSALVVAVARPTMEQAVAREQASVVLTIDLSGSMAAEDVSPTRIAAAQDAANAFLDQVPENVKVGLVTFASGVDVQVNPTTDRDAVRVAIDGLQPGGGTALGDAIARSADVAASSVQDDASAAEGAFSPASVSGGEDEEEAPPAVVLLLSDGANSVGRLEPQDAAQLAAQQGVPIDTVALGTPDGQVTIDPQDGTEPQTIPVPPDPETLQAVSDATGGRFFDAPTAEALKTVYERVGSSVATATEQTDVGYWFAGAGAVLLLAGAGLSALWFNRIP